MWYLGFLSCRIDRAHILRCPGALAGSFHYFSSRYRPLRLTSCFFSSSRSRCTPAHGTILSMNASICIDLSPSFSFYCIILLTALFTSSCYWQPVPTRALLQDVFPTVTSASPLLYQSNASEPDNGTIPASELLPMPSLTKLLDRCWCDLAGGHLFEPYNITLWQLTSLSRTLAPSQSQQVLVAQEIDLAPDQVPSAGVSKTQTIASVWVLKMTGKDALRADEGGAGLASSIGSIVSRFCPSMRFPFPLEPSLPFPFNIGRRPSRDTSDQSSTTTVASALENSPLDKISPPFLRRQYDLRPHGVHLVVDFGWGRGYA